MEPDHVDNVANYARDVTIFLMPNSTASPENQNSHEPTSNKRKRTNVSEEECAATQESTRSDHHGLAPLCVIHANSTRMRQCSKYFESLMSGRWTVQTDQTAPGQQTSSLSSRPAMKFFHLEAQTEARYYQDCFSRMNLLHRPISSVRQCLELLKVASQIEYKELMDICLRCLPAIPWTSDEEEQIREFCVSGQYLSSDSASDLTTRLQLPLTKRDKEKGLRTCVKRTLSRYLTCSLEHEGISEYYIREESRQMFENAFLAIVSGSDSALIHYALTLGKDSSKRLLCSVKGFCDDVTKFRPAYYLYRSIIDILDDVSNFWWLFQFLRKANAVQAVVEVLVKDHEISDLFLEAGYSIYCSHKEFWPEWRGVQMTLIKMVVVIFEDILGGRVFLNSSDRMTLFHQWKWILQNTAEELATSAPRTCSIVTVLASFIRTFPLPEQEEVIRSWMRRDHDHRYERNFDYRDLTEAHTTWIMRLISEVVYTSSRELMIEGNSTTSATTTLAVTASTSHDGQDGRQTADLGLEQASVILIPAQAGVSKAGIIGSPRAVEGHEASGSRVRDQDDTQ